MEALTALASNGIWSLIAVIAILVLVVIAIKKGWVKYNKGLKIGQSDDRMLIQNQQEYAHACCEGVLSKLPPHLDQYRAKYIICRAEQMIDSWILNNHMTTNKDYIMAKQQMLYNCVMKRISDDFFKTDEFKKFVYEFTEDLISDLVKMKDMYYESH